MLLYIKKKTFCIAMNWEEIYDILFEMKLKKKLFNNNDFHQPQLTRKSALAIIHQANHVITFQ